MPPIPGFACGNDRVSHVPGEPKCAYALLSDPGRSGPTRPYSETDAAPEHLNAKGTHDELSFEAQSHGLGTRCLRFAGWITPPPRKTRFRLPARLYRTGLIPAGFQRKVSELSPT